VYSESGGYPIAEEVAPADTLLIAIARSAVPALIEECERLRDKLSRAIDGWEESLTYDSVWPARVKRETETILRLRDELPDE
jgi:hypothetical protein